MRVFAWRGRDRKCCIINCFQTATLQHKIFSLTVALESPEQPLRAITRCVTSLSSWLSLPWQPRLLLPKCKVNSHSRPENTTSVYYCISLQNTRGNHLFCNAGRVINSGGKVANGNNNNINTGGYVIDSGGNIDNGQGNIIETTGNRITGGGGSNFINSGGNSGKLMAECGAYSLSI